MFNSLRLTLSSPSKSYTFTGLDDSPIKIGRSLKCEFSVPFEDLSREHCLIEFQNNNEYFITDLGSSNGVWIDRERIPVNVKTPITPESKIILSNLYTLSITPVEIKTSSDIINKLPDNRSSEDAETVTFKIELEERPKTGLFQNLTQKKLSGTTPRKKDAGEDVEIQHSYEYLKMIVGFIVVVGFIFYHFLSEN